MLMQVSGRPVLVLEGSVPMYRTLGPGASGDDVKQLKQALSRLGFYPGDTTAPTAGAASAVTRWYKSKGFPAEEPSADKQQLGVLEQAVLSAQQQLLAAKDPGGDSKDSDPKGDSDRIGGKGAPTARGTGTSQTGARGARGTGAEPAPTAAPGCSPAAAVGHGERGTQRLPGRLRDQGPRR